METPHDAAERVLRALRTRPRGMTITEIARQTRITRNSVSKHLEVLRIAGQVDMRAVGNAKVYSLARRVPLSTFLCFTTDLIIVLDKNGTVLQINDHLLSFSGMKEEEVIGNNIRDLPIPVVSGDKTLSIIEGVGQEQFTTDVWDTHDGANSCYRMQVIPTVFEDGGQGRTIVLEDITEKRQYLRNMEFLTQTAMEFVDMPEDTDIYDRIAEMIHSFVPEGRVFIQSYDELRNQFTIRSVVDADFKACLTSLIGRDPVGMTFPLDEVYGSPYLYNPQEIERGIREFSFTGDNGGDSLSFFEMAFRRVPEDIFQEIIRTLDIGKAYIAFLVWNGKLLGDVGIFLSRQDAIRDINALESFIRQGSIAISRQIAEERLCRSNERFREVVEYSPFPAAILSVDGKFTYINNMFIQVLGYTMEDIATGNDWLCMVFPDEGIRQSVTKTWHAECEHAGVNQIRSRSYTVRCKDGDIKRIRMRAQRLCDNTHYLMIEDITQLWQTHTMLLSDMCEQKKSTGEDHLKCLALSSMGCAVAVSDADGSILYVNPAFISLWQYPSAHDVVGRDAAELWWGDMGPDHHCLISKNNGEWSGILTGVRRDTSTFRVYGVFRAVSDGAGQGTGRVGTFIEMVSVDMGGQLLLRSE